MPDLFVRDVPEELVQSLELRAMRNGRDLQGELLAILKQAISAPDVDSPLPRGFRRGTRTIEDIAARLRTKYPEPIRGLPLGVDIIRKDRDSR